jgi:hypothetical protein
MLVRESLHFCTHDSISPSNKMRSFTTHYLTGWLEKLIANEDNKVRLILLEFSSANYSRIIELLPLKSVIVTIYHGDNYFNLKELVEYRKFYGLPQVGLVVLNHEQPWISAFAMTKDDYPHRNRFLNHFYGHFKIVLRNYYFLPLKQSALFFPLGPMYHNSPLTTEHREFFSKGSALPSSARRIRCSFRGRLAYATNSIHHENRFDLFRVRIQCYRIHYLYLFNKCYRFSSLD